MNSLDNLNIGIEVETEFKDEESYYSFLDTFNSKYANNFISVQDASLRGYSREFVTIFPRTVSQIKEFIPDFEADLKESGIERSFRTSIHIHLDLQQLTEHEIITLFNWFRFFEKDLFEYVFTTTGVNRTPCPYCIPTWNLPIKKITKRNFDNLLNNLTNKYSGLNFRSYFNLGSLEVRIHSGLSSDDSQELIIPWIEKLLDIYNLKNTRFSYTQSKKVKNLFFNKDNYIESVKRFFV